MPMHAPAQAPRRAAPRRSRPHFACWYITAPAFAPLPELRPGQALDNLTHTLVGVTLARTPLGRAGRGTMAALVLASNAPDIDIVAAAGGSLKYLGWHRGPTQGPLGIVGLGVVVAAIVAVTRRVRATRATGDHEP